jgi:hypothetical protein
MQLLPKVLASLTICSLMAGWACADEPKKSDESAAESKEDKAEAEREEAFTKLLSGATLVGHFTVTGEKMPGEPKEEKYTITKLSKFQGDIWLFQVRIQYGDHDVTLPLPLPVKWAGDTPMIYLDNVLVPGLGTFNSRVIFSEGKYAGTWSAKDHGGHLYGQIIPPGEEKEKETEPAEKNEKK